MICIARHYNVMMTAYDEILEHDSDPDWEMLCAEICANIRPNDLDGDSLEKTLYLDTHCQCSANVSTCANRIRRLLARVLASRGGCLANLVHHLDANSGL